MGKRNLYRTGLKQAYLRASLIRRRRRVQPGFMNRASRAMLRARRYRALEPIILGIVANTKVQYDRMHAQHGCADPACGCHMMERFSAN